MSYIKQLQDTTLQFGDQNGNIVHQGVLGACVGQSGSLTSTFPTTSTGTSLGHYHYTESGTNALQFINCSGSGTGGHKFYTANSTTAPTNTATIDINGITIDKSIQGGAVLVNLPSIISGQPNQVVFSFPPGLDTFGIQFGVYTNPVQVLFNSGPFVTGVTYYAQATNAQTLRIRLTTNPLDPEMDCSSFTFGQIAFAYVQSNLPSTVNIINLNEALEITRDDTFSSLNYESLVIQDNINNRQALTYAFQSVYQDNTTGKSTSILAPVPLFNNQVFNSSTPTSSVIIEVDTPAITTTNNTDVSVLTADDLTFNGDSLLTQIDDIEKSVSKLQYANPINIANSPAIYGTLPSSPPMVPTTNAINTGFNGWYYKNISTAYNNISWSVGFQPSSYVVSNLKGFYFTFVSLTTTSKPFVSVYTLPAQPPGGFYNSRRSYVPAIAPATITAGIPYIYYYMYDNAYPTPFKYCHQAVPLTLSGTNPVGAFGANELLYFMSINTNSISAVGTEELIISEAGVIIDDGTGTLIQPFSFNSASVYSPNSYKTVLQGAGTITPTLVDNGTTYVATANFTISNAGLSGVPAGFFIIVQGNSADRTITYNTSSTKIVHTNTGSTNASQVNFYWNGTQFVPYF